MHPKDYSTNLTCMHPNQPGLVWREKDKCLFKSCMIIPYTDEINWESLFSTTVYRKPIFTGEYTRCNSVYSKKRKINLIFTHVHRANCSQSNLQVKRTKIRSIFQNNDCCLDKRVVRYIVGLDFDIFVGLDKFKTGRRWSNACNEHGRRW